LAGVAMLSVADMTWAQSQQSEPAPAVTPARPVILPMTPGSELHQPKPKSPTKPRPRIITAPGAKVTETAKKEPVEQLGKTATTDYTFCNKTSFAVNVAVGVRNGGLWLTRGWWTVPAGECKPVITGLLTLPIYYVFARSVFAHTGTIRTWGGSQTLCTGNGPFQATSDGSGDCSAGYEPQGFAKVETEGKSAWTTTLSETSEYKTLEQARTAGLQRLLADLGRFDGPIDGVAGPKFNEALAQARSELGIAQTDSSTVYGRLLTEATKVQAVAGLTFCNRTQDVIWTALGTEYEGKKESKGWWRLQPGQCAKVIKDRLDERAVYGFAVADKIEGVPETWGGNDQFCTKVSSFEINEVTDCSGSGFTATGFMPIETAGRLGLTFEFTPRRADARPQ
jgi:uncharacterized membrane protein